ncbi:MAG: signal peptidase I [Lachnospiraceae bacterium]|nr:signal peptidase I [Lachnospiraceae bacterium]
MERKRNIRKEVFSWIRMFVIVVAVVFVATRFIIINATIPSGSMETTIMTSDRLIGFRFSYWFEDPERGDIILFSYPVDESQTYIKRVIGLPGETVEIRDGGIYIDGSDTPLEEDYLFEEWYWENDG